jgi:hypothetical protein
MEALPAQDLGRADLLRDIPQRPNDGTCPESSRLSPRLPGMAMELLFVQSEAKPRPSEVCAAADANATLGYSTLNRPNRGV